MKTIEDKRKDTVAAVSGFDRLCQSLSTKNIIANLTQEINKKKRAKTAFLKGFQTSIPTL